MIEFVVPYGSTRDLHVYALEVGTRALWHTEHLPRDMRWWRGIWEKRRTV